MTVVPLLAARDNDGHSTRSRGNLAVAQGRTLAVERHHGDAKTQTGKKGDERNRAERPKGKDREPPPGEQLFKPGGKARGEAIELSKGEFALRTQYGRTVGHAGGTCRDRGKRIDRRGIRHDGIALIGDQDQPFEGIPWHHGMGGVVHSVSRCMKSAATLWANAHANKPGVPTVADDPVQRLLVLPSGAPLPPGRRNALLAKRDVTLRPAETEALKQHAAQGDAARVMAIAAAHLGSEPRCEALRLAAFTALQETAFAARLIACFEGTGQWPHHPIVEASLYLLACAHTNHAPRFDTVSKLVWSSAARWLSDYCPAETVRTLSEAIARHFPDLLFVPRLLAAASEVPPALPGDQFWDRQDSCAQFVRTLHPEPRGLLVCLCGFHGRMGIPLNFLHRWATRIPYHTLYLRDLSQSYYRTGLPVFGSAMVHTTAALGRLQKALGVDELAFYGSSMGGLVAIRLGLALNAQRILSAAGTVDSGTTAGSREPTDRERLEITRRGAARLAQDLDGREHGRIAYLYGADHERDAVVGATLAQVSGVETMVLDDLNRHNIDFHLVLSKRYDRVFSWLAGDRKDIDLKN
jgi:hypothetical protein